MASPLVTTHPTLRFKKSRKIERAPALSPKGLKDTAPARVLSPNGSKEELVRVLERAANDDAFIAQLTD
jgi:hypothetical protein